MRKSMMIAALALSGCASTPGGLQKPEYATTFTIDAGYQQVLKNIADGTRECPPFQMLPIGQQINDVQHYPDLREGKITLGSSGIGTQIIQVIEVRESQPGKAQVTVYTKAAASRATYVANAKRWASGDFLCK